MFLSRVFLGGLVGALLADIPSSGCGSNDDRRRPIPTETTLLVAAPDCSCAPSTMEVAIDNQVRRTLGCTTSERFAVDAGRHTVTAAAPGCVFEPVSVEIRAGEIANVKVACPTR